MDAITQGERWTRAEGQASRLSNEGAIITVSLLTKGDVKAQTKWYFRKEEVVSYLLVALKNKVRTEKKVSETENSERFAGVESGIQW